MLANVLHARMRRQVGRTPRLGERIDVVALEELALRLHRFAFGAARLASEEEIGRRLAEAITAELSDMPARFGKPFFLQEWTNVVDTWQIDRWEAYRGVRRLGRKTRLTEAQRAATWRVFEQVRASLAADALIPSPACSPALQITMLPERPHHSRMSSSTRCRTSASSSCASCPR